MPNISLLKQAGTLAPADSETADFIYHLKLGQIIHADFKRKRNSKFHRKYFALLNFAYDHLETGDHEYKGQAVEKNFDQFREDLTILAGYFTMVYRIDGAYRPKAKSISFAVMDDEAFEKLYNATINVILKKVLVNYTREQLDEVVSQLMSFA